LWLSELLEVPASIRAQQYTNTW